MKDTGLQRLFVSRPLSRDVGWVGKKEDGIGMATAELLERKKELEKDRY